MNRDSTIDSEYEAWACGDDCHDYDAEDHAGEAELQERLDAAAGRPENGRPA